MAELGTAYILIEPSMKGSQEKITNELTGAGKAAGKSASGSFGNSFVKGIGTVAKVGTAAFVALGTATIGTTVAMVKGANEVATYGDNIDKMSQKMGLTAQAYQEWDFVMQHSGTSMETMKSSMKTLANAAENGNEAFQALGITQEQIASMSQEELFGATIAGLQNVTDDTQRTYLAGKLLGRGATELGALLNMSAEDTDALKQQLHDLGGVMSDEDVKASAAFKDSLMNLQIAGVGLKNSLMMTLVPGLTMVMDGITGLATGVPGAAAMITSGVQTAVSAFGQMLPQILEVVNGLAMGLLQAAPTIIQNLATGILEAIPILLPTIMSVVGSLVSTFIELLPQLIEVGLQVITQLVMGIAQALPELIPAAVETILNLVMYLVDNVDLMVDAAVALITGLAIGVVNAIPILIEKAPEIIAKFVQAIIRAVPKLLEAGVQIITTLGSGVASAWEAAKTWGSSVINKIKSGITTAFSSLRSTISSKFASVVALIQAPFDTAKAAVTKAVNAIKNLFNFSWSLPKLKMPHFSVGSGPTVLGITLPTISVSWYAKAQAQPYLFTSPTVVGSASGLRGFGENGDEIVYGRENLLRDIASVTNRPINLYIDGDKLVGSTLGSTDQQLGRVSELKARFVGV